jgi:hypothetical protein
MNRLLAGTPVLALVLGAGFAQADQVVGSVEYVDAADNVVIVKGQPFTFEPAVKLTPADIKVGEKVRLEYNATSFVVYEAAHAKGIGNPDQLDSSATPTK